MTEEMQTEIEKRIEEGSSQYINFCKDNMHSVSEAYCRADFQAGAKFILEMPEMKEAIENYTDLKALYEEEINLAQHQRGRRLFINDERIIQQQRKMLIASNSAAFNTLKSILSDRIGINEVEKIIRDSRERSLESLKKAGLCE